MMISWKKLVNATLAGKTRVPANSTLNVETGGLLQSNGTTVNIGASAGVTAGTAAASKALIVDASKNIAGLNNITAAGQITANGATGGVGYSAGAGGAITQITSSSTGVTVNTPTGQITTVALTTAAGAEERFTVTCSACAATDVPVIATTYNGAGTVGLSVQKVAAGAFDLVITNLHASAAFNAAMVINYALIKGVAA